MKGKIADREVEWDDAKNEINIQKHHLSLPTAALVFADENRLEIFDAEHSGSEDRYITIGKSSKVLFVVFTERADGVTRIISGRFATAEERRLYYGSI